MAEGAWRTTTLACSPSAMRSHRSRAWRFEIVDVFQVVFELVDVRVKSAVGAARLVELVEIRVERIRRLLNGAQYIEALDVAAALQIALIRSSR